MARKTATKTADVTVEDVIYQTAAIVQNIIDKYNLPADVALEIYKWEISTFLSYGGNRQSPVETLTGEPDGEDTGSGTGNVIGIDGRPAN